MMKQTDVLIQQFFEAAAESDEQFLRTLQRILSVAHQLAVGPPDQARPALPFGRVIRAGLAGQTARFSPVRENLQTYSANKPGRSEASEIDSSGCSVGEALGEMLLANGWTKQEAAGKLGLSEQVCHELLNEMMPLTGKTARSVAAFLCETYDGASAQLLADYLLNGLHFWGLKHSGPGHTRIAARRKGSPNDKKKP